MGTLPIILSLLLWASAQDMDSKQSEYSNMWIAEIHGGEQVAQRVARDLGYTYSGKASPFKDHYVLFRDDHPKFSTRDSHHLTKTLLDLDEVKWAEQQKTVKRSKRGYIPMKERGQDNNGKNDKIGNNNNFGPNPDVHLNSENMMREIFQRIGLTNIPSSITSKPSCANSPGGLFSCIKIPPNLLRFMANSVQGDLTKLGTFSTKPAEKEQLATYNGPTKHIETLSQKISAYALMFNDPLWKKQWYMQDYRTSDGPVMDHNIVPVYNMGYTGKGVTVAVVDDGVQGNHPDLVNNFREDLSYDYCLNVPGCEPPYDELNTPSHGTQCAGEIAMSANNNYCGVGVAYNSSFGGVRVLCQSVVGYSEARSLIHKLESYDIYSNSWGPHDDGVTFNAVEHMTDLALRAGVTEGRKGKGAIYTFSCGNGREYLDNCGSDSLVNHFATIGIAAVDQRGRPSYYSERCTAVFVSTYSMGGSNEEGVVSSYINNYCTWGFSGTSAAAPLASGIIALVLEANPELTYRDVMHLIAMTSEVAPLADNPYSWYKNGRGFWVSNDFGFGLLNAENMVTMAKTWKNVAEKHTCIITITLEKPLTIGLLKNAKIPFKIEACQNSETESVSYLEAIDLAPRVVYPYRGAISIKITSPAGTETDILETRMNDNSNSGLLGYSIKSVHNWGEDPKGTWNLEVKAHTLPGLRGASGYISEFTLTLHGTAEKPAHYNKPRKYAAFRLPDGKTMLDTKKKA